MVSQTLKLKTQNGPKSKSKHYMKLPNTAYTGRHGRKTCLTKVVERSILYNKVFSQEY